MDYEKAYKEALERAKAGKPMDEVFPEWKESEDERIRKEIVGFIEQVLKDKNVLLLVADRIGDDIPNMIPGWIACLEKQKEKTNQTQVEREYVRTLKSLIADFLRGKEEIDRTYYQDIYNWLDGYHVEPKELKEYLAASPAERRKMNMNEILGENKERKEKSCALTNAPGRELISSSGKDKNLDEIAQEYIDGVKQYNPEPTWDLMQTAVCYGYHLGKEQKPAEWSEEDEDYLVDVKSAVNDYFDEGYADELCTWLKSLRPQPKQEWSEEDSNTCNNIIERLESFIQYERQCVYRAHLEKEIKWLKERLPLLKPKQEIAAVIDNQLWKPSEEQMKALKYALGNGGNYNKIALDTLYNDLKSL